MSSEIKALVLRRTVSRITDLTGGALMLAPFQWGLATLDDTLVCRDEAGVFHTFPGANAIGDIIDDSRFAKEPVGSYAQLPSTDMDGTMRLVDVENKVYVKDNGTWKSVGGGSVEAPLVLTTDGIGTDNAITVRGAGGGSKYYTVDVSTLDPKMTIADGNYALTSEAHLFRIRDVANWVDVTSTGISVHQGTPLHNMVITAEDITKDGVSVLGGPVDAANVSFTPTGSIAATDVQAAIAELDSEVVHIAGDETITGNKTFGSKLIQVGLPTSQSVINGTLLGKIGFVADDDSADQSLRRAAEIEAVGTMTWDGSVSGVKLAHKLWFGPDTGGLLRDILVLENGDGSINGKSYVKATGTLQVLTENATNGARIELARPNGVLASFYGYLPGDTSNTVVLSNTSGNGILQLITNSETPGYIAIGGGDSSAGLTDTYVRISNSPITEGNIGNASAANMGGYSTSGFATWGGDIAPSTTNYGLYIKGDATTAELNGTTYSYLSVGSAGRVRAGTADVLISPTGVVAEQITIRKYTGSSVAAIYNNAITPSNTNYCILLGSANTEINGTTSARLNVSNVSIATATSTGLAVTGTLSSSGAATVQSLAIVNGEQAHTTTSTVTLVPGKLHKLSTASKTFTISAASMAVGDICFVDISNGCPTSIVSYTDSWGTATQLSLSPSVKYSFIVRKSASGVSFMGGAT